MKDPCRRCYSKVLPELTDQYIPDIHASLPSIHLVDIPISVCSRCNYIQVSRCTEDVLHGCRNKLMAFSRLSKSRYILYKDFLRYFEWGGQTSENDVP